MPILILALTLVLGLALTPPAFAQEVNVVALSPSDASDSARLYKAKQEADAAWEKQRAKISTIYVEARKGEIGICFGESCFGESCKPSVAGFEYGFEFSRDFKFVVPKAPPVSPNWKPEIWSNPAYLGTSPWLPILNGTTTVTSRPISFKSTTAQQPQPRYRLDGCTGPNPDDPQCVGPLPPACSQCHTNMKVNLNEHRTPFRQRLDRSGSRLGADHQYFPGLEQARLRPGAGED